MNSILKVSFLLLSFFIFSCANENTAKEEAEVEEPTATAEESSKEETTPTAEAAEVYQSEAGRKVLFYKYDAFKKAELEKEDEHTYVVNFWATWCGPCVKELPYFFEAEQAYEGKNVKFIYASLDFKRQIEKKLLPFVDKKEMDAVFVLDQKNAEWMKDVDESWDGAIPATLVFNKKGSKFYRESFESTEDVMKIIEENL
jgi:thiol-disulfide isomerase/thioredoxin